MREESHLDDMRRAIRGDFERLAERRGSQELMREVPESEPELETEPAVEVSEIEAESELEAEKDDAVESRRRSWLARVLGL